MKHYVIKDVKRNLDFITHHLKEGSTTNFIYDTYIEIFDGNNRDKTELSKEEMQLIIEWLKEE